MKDPKIREQVEGSASEKMKAIASMWKEADEETKRPYVEESARLKEEMKTQMRDEAEAAESDDAKSEASTEPVEHKSAPVASSGAGTSADEVDAGAMIDDVDALFGDDEEEESKPMIDITAFPKYSHNMMKMAFYLDEENETLYDINTKALVGPVSNMGGIAGFTKIE
jgi:hypothetical protein